MSLSLDASVDDIISYINKNDKYVYHILYIQADYTNLINTRNYVAAFHFATKYDYGEIIINILNHDLITTFSFSRNYIEKCVQIMKVNFIFSCRLDFYITRSINNNYVNLAKLCIDRGYNGYSAYTRLFSAIKEDPAKLILFAIIENRATILKKLLSIESYHTHHAQMDCAKIVYFAYKRCSIDIINLLKKDFRFFKIIEKNKYELLHLANKYGNICIVRDILNDNTFNKSKILLSAYFQKNNNDINSIFPSEIVNNIINIHNNILINHHKNNK
jgi:hypothetical protein